VARALLVRHCESSGQAPDAPLTTRGSVQAEALAEFLAPRTIGRILSSPYLRARQSIEPLARKAGLELEIDARLAERNLSPRPIDGWREVVRRSFEDPGFSVHWGESGAETLARGLAAIRPALDAAADGLVVIASHGQLLSLVMHSIDPGFGFAGWKALSNPKNRGVFEVGLRSVEVARRNGVELGLGTDLLGEARDQQADELAIRAELEPAADVLRAMYRTNARLCRLEGEIGLVRAGAHADLVLCDSNPLEDLASLSRATRVLSHVIKAGRVVRRRD